MNDNIIDKNIPPNSTNYENLVGRIGDLLSIGRTRAAQEINTILVRTYWEIGKYIVEFEQKGKLKAEYGTELFERLSKDLTFKYGKGFSKSNLIYIRKLYISFPKSETLSHKLTWSHYFEILKSDSKLEISFYLKQTEKEKWSVRELKRQMKSLLFHRIALSTDKEGVFKLASKGFEAEKPEDLLKDPFVVEFLDISLQSKYIDHGDVGQMNLYLNYFKKEEATEGDNEPVGIILGASKNHILVEYATQSITNKVLLAKYQLYLPDKKELETALSKILDIK